MFFHLQSHYIVCMCLCVCVKQCGELPLNNKEFSQLTFMYHLFKEQSSLFI